MWAHHHSYQRTCAVYREECVDGAPIHTVIGMGGRELSTDLIPYVLNYSITYLLIQWYLPDLI